MRYYMWKAISFDVPSKTVYAWYQPKKREAMNVNHRSLRICSTSSGRIGPGKKDTSEPSHDAARGPQAASL